MAKQHGMYGTPTYKSWAEMKYRCGNPKRKDYVNVSYCKEWEDFRNFFKDMGERPVGTSLDRIDVHKGYCPENCRWADDLTQENNRTNNRFFEYNGELLTLPQIARKYNISRSNLANKIYLLKKDITEAVDYLRGNDLSQSVECLQKQ